MTSVDIFTDISINFWSFLFHGAGPYPKENCTFLSTLSQKSRLDPCPERSWIFDHPFIAKTKKPHFLKKLNKIIRFKYPCKKKSKAKNFNGNYRKDFLIAHSFFNNSIFLSAKDVIVTYEFCFGVNLMTQATFTHSILWLQEGDFGPRFLYFPFCTFLHPSALKWMNH